MPNEPSSILPRNRRMAKIRKSTDTHQYIKRLKEEKNIEVSLKVFDKFTISFSIKKKKNLIKQGIEGNDLNLIKDLYQQPIENLILNYET